MNRLRAILSAIDLADVMFFGGLVMLGVGLTQFHDGLGLSLVGALLVAYTRPLSRWIK